MATPLLSYLIASPSSGTVSSLVDTSSGTALNLTCTSVTGTSIASGVGATFGSSSGAISAALNGTKVATALAGATKCTLEFVVDTTGVGNYKAIGGIQSSAFDDIFDVSTGGASDQISVNWPGGNVAFDCVAGQHRIQVVLDNTQATSTDRIKAWVDGSAATVNSVPTVPTYPALNAALDAGFTNWANNRMVLGCLTSAGVNSFTGPIYFGMLYPAALTSTDASGHNTSLSSNNDADPNGSGVSVALTGLAATVSRGTMAPAWSGALTGIAATSARGTASPAVAAPLTGAAATSGRGTLTPAVSAPLTGQAANSAGGTVTPPSSGVSAALTGQSVTVSGGTMTPAIGVSLTGQAATSARGTATPAISVGLTGNSATSAGGGIIAAIVRSLTGLFATTAQGTVTSGFVPSQVLRPPFVAVVDSVQTTAVVDSQQLTVTPDT